MIWAYLIVSDTPRFTADIVLLELKLEKPIEVLFEGADEDVYKQLNKSEISTEFLDWLNNKVPEKFAFLFVQTTFAV